ncbi:MAG: hypothetical protein A2Z04_08830 [Chloroflexi bacterium RBG_16_57_9]|nr:MAG: hypothetical protein A2Z04_08830 [Chloroflexi bacterium RBG_16_57_9]
MLAVGDLEALVRGACVRGVVLNSCESDELAETLHDATGADVVCTMVAIPDETAFQTAALFAEHLGESGDFRAAYELAKPGGVAYRYVPEYRESLVMAPERYVFSNEELRTIYEAINDIRQRLSVVEIELRYVRQDLNGRKTDLRVSAQWVIVLFGFLVSLITFILLYFNVTGSL